MHTLGTKVGLPTLGSCATGTPTGLPYLGLLGSPGFSKRDLKSTTVLYRVCKEFESGAILGGHRICFGLHRRYTSQHETPCSPKKGFCVAQYTLQMGVSHNQGDLTWTQTMGSLIQGPQIGPPVYRNCPVVHEPPNIRVPKQTQTY